jgi:hypothetical protein
MFVMQIEEGQFISDCVNCAIKGSRNEILVCLVSVSLGFVIRHFEKKRLLKKEEEKNNSNK